MNRRQLMMSSALAVAARRVSGQIQQPQDSPENFRLKDYLRAFAQVRQSVPA
jgi:hypothetical protein